MRKGQKETRKIMDGRRAVTRNRHRFIHRRGHGMKERDIERQKVGLLKCANTFTNMKRENMCLMMLIWKEPGGLTIIQPELLKT